MRCAVLPVSRFRVERLLIFDRHVGGMGMAAAAAPRFTALLQHALQLVTECPCQEDKGCPNCIQHTDCK